MNIDSKTSRPGRPKSEEKRERIQQAAANLFLSVGFERTSMDTIATEAGVSKQTVYSHFKNKDDLFRSCIAGKIRKYELALDPAEHKSLENGLRATAEGYLQLISDPGVISMWRLVIHESPLHKHVAKTFYEAGPNTTYRHLSEFLKQHRDGLNTTRFDAAARMFYALVADAYQTRLMLGLIEQIPEDERKRHAQTVVAQFLRVYGT